MEIILSCIGKLDLTLKLSVLFMAHGNGRSCFDVSDETLSRIAETCCLSVQLFLALPEGIELSTSHAALDMM